MKVDYFISNKGKTLLCFAKKHFKTMKTNKKRKYNTTDLTQIKHSSTSYIWYNIVYSVLLQFCNPYTLHCITNE